MGSYYLSVWRKAVELWRERIREDSRAAMKFILATGILYLVLRAAPGLGSFHEKIGEITALVLSSIAAAALSLAWDFFRAPAVIDAEKSKLIKAQAAALSESDKNKQPRLVIERLLRKTEDPIHYVEVWNPSPLLGLQECLVEVESMVNVDSGAEILNHKALRTENQTGDRPKGRFNLDADQRKRLPLYGLGAGPGMFRIHLAESMPKFPVGHYQLQLRASTNMGGGPDKVTVVIKGGNISLTRT